jgi:hypothetical protein
MNSSCELNFKYLLERTADVSESTITKEVDGYTINFTPNSPKSNVYTPYVFDIGYHKAYRQTIVLTRWPTGNCQLSSIAYMASLLSLIRTAKGTIVKEDIYKIFNGIFEILKFRSPMLLFDVQKIWIEHMEKCFKVIGKMPYISTNNSEMCIFLCHNG